MGQIYEFIAALSLPEIAPGLQVPSLESVQLGTWVLVGLLVIWLVGLVRTSLA